MISEYRCKELIDKLCHNFSWKVVQDPDMPYVLLKNDGKCGAYRHSWLGLFINFANMAWGRCIPFSEGFPEWTKTWFSLEELAIKIDIHCC